MPQPLPQGRAAVPGLKPTFVPRWGEYPKHEYKTQTHKPEEMKLNKLSIACSVMIAPLSLQAAEKSYVTTVKPIYTTQLKDSLGGTNQTISKLKVGLEMLNTAFVNSQVDFEMQMVFPREISRLTDTPMTNLGATWSLIKDNNVQGIYTEYVNQGADHLAYFDSLEVGAGLAFVPGEFSFHGGAGNTVFRHEMGHNLSLSHSDGFQTSVGNTIMNGNSLPYFSNPNVTYQGVALGDATHNSAAKLTTHRPTATQRHLLNVDANTTQATWTFIAKHSSKALDVPGGATTAGTVISQYTPNYGTAQQWQCNDFSGGASTLERSAGTARFASFTANANGTSLTLQNWATGKQRYFIEEQTDGFLRIRRDDGNGVFDVSGASQNNSATVLQWDWSGGNHQKWKPVQSL